MPLIQLNDWSALVTVLCLLICLTYFSLQVLQRMYISNGFTAARCLPKRPFSTSLITAMIQHLKLNQNFVNMVYFDHRVYCKGLIYFILHCMRRTQWFLNQVHCTPNFLKLFLRGCLYMCMFVCVHTWGPEWHDVVWYEPHMIG